MCEHHSEGEVGEDAGNPRSRPALSRRGLLTAAAVTPLGAGVAGRYGAPPAAAATVDGAYSMAMHVHASFSERQASMNAHLQQATAHGVDVVWWTEHDTVMNGERDRHVVHFTSLTDERGDGAAWLWTQLTGGTLTSGSTGGIVPTPASPKDTVPQGSLAVTAQGADGAPAFLGFGPANLEAKQTWRSNLTGQTISLEVLPTSIGPDAYLELLLDTSYHPASGGRSAGSYSVFYRFGGDGPPRRVVGRRVEVTVPVTVGRWNSVAVSPTSDLAAAFPDLDPRDFSLFNLRLSARSRAGAKASGFFDYLRFSRGTTGEVALQVQDDLMTSYASRYPRVAQHHALEVSHWLPHVNWFGGDVFLPDNMAVSKLGWDDYLRTTCIPAIHAAGGLASYNHPFGVGVEDTVLPVATQDQLLRDVAVRMLGNGALGADILEVGYPLRSGVGLRHHVRLWDILSRNGLFLTGNGVTDDHTGIDWLHRRLNWTTSAWASNTREATLLQSLKAGRVWCGSLSAHAGALDLTVDGTCPMGSVSVSRQTTRRARLTATGVPPGGSLRVVQGQVDYAGTADPRAATSVVAEVPGTALLNGQLDLQLDTRRSSYVRTEVRTSSGGIVALSNPVWMMRAAPPGGIPAARAA
jgi:hypothetical protein